MAHGEALLPLLLLAALLDLSLPCARAGLLTDISHAMRFDGNNSGHLLCLAA